MGQTVGRRCAMDRRMLALALCLLALAADPKPQAAKPATAPAPAPAGEIGGRVTGPGGKPVAGATVRVSVEPSKEGKDKRGSSSKPVPPVLAKTSEDGSFTVKGLAGTTFTVRVEAEASAPFTVREIPPGASVKVALKAGGALSGKILDLATKKSLPRADVLVCDPDSRGFGDDACRKVTTGEDGAFRVAGLAPGVVSVEARAAAHARRRLDSVRIAAVN